MRREDYNGKCMSLRSPSHPNILDEDPLQTGLGETEEAASTTPSIEPKNATHCSFTFPLFPFPPPSPILCAKPPTSPNVAASVTPQQFWPQVWQARSDQECRSQPRQLFRDLPALGGRMRSGLDYENPRGHM